MNWRIGNICNVTVWQHMAAFCAS